MTTTTNGKNSAPNDVQRLSRIVGDAPWRIGTVKPNETTVDHTVQRDLMPGRSEKMAEVFDPAAAGVVTISERSDGTLHVVDGQHRFEAARLATLGNQDFPAKIFTGLTRKQEAALFILLNRTSVPSPIFRYNVSLVAEDPRTVAIEKVIREYGWRVAAGGRAGTIEAPATLEWIYDQDPDGKRKVLERTIALVTTAWGTDADAVSAVILRGVGAFMSSYAEHIHIESMARSMKTKWSSPLGLTSQARQLKEIQGGSGYSAMRTILAKMYNKRRTVGALPEVAVEESETDE